MSFRRTSRVKNKTTPKLVNPLTTYDSLKRRLDCTEDDTITHAKKLARVDLPAIPTQMAEIFKQRTPTFSSRPPSMDMGRNSTSKSGRRRLFNDGVMLDTPKTDSTVYLKSRGDTTTISTTPSATAPTFAKCNPEGYDRLSRTIKDSLKYPLPTKFQALYDHFEMMEMILSVCAHEKRCITFDDLSENVKLATRKDLPLSTFAQIMGVYPSAYNLQLLKKRKTKSVKQKNDKIPTF
uniref:CDT1 domain-containing protein n=1 Tax=Panagrellus redivivus TaxID=6233 RepID=A0A7E4ZQW3_PANRE